MTPQWSTACLDWQDRIVEGRSLIPVPPLFRSEAEAALDVFRSLRVPDLPGQPTFGEVAAPWVMDFVRAIFGAHDPETGRRLIRQFFLLISKKNGKSTIAAGIMLTALIRNWRREAGMSILAPTIEVANNSYGPASAMVRADPVLSDLIHVRDHIRTLEHRGTRARLRVVAADAETAAGSKDGMVLVDELWLFGKSARAKAMLDEATGGLASRPEGFVVYLSTHSDEPAAGVFAEKLHYARGVRDGEIDDPQFLPVLYEWPRTMLERQDYLKPELFHVTNPNLGRSVDMGFLKSRLAEAMASQDRRALQIFLAKHLNVEIGVRLGSRRWAGADYWEAAALPGLTLEELIARSSVLVAGIDGGGLDDLLGFAVLGRCRETRAWLHWGHAWAHRSVLERRKDIVSVIEGLAAAGDLTICDSATEDVEDVAALAARLWATGRMPEKACIGLDPVGISAIVDAIAAAGVPQDAMIGIGQGYRLSPAIWGVERKLADGTFRHGGQALMTWAISNAVTEVRGGSVVITKETAGRAKIDPLVALFNAAMLMARNPESARRSVYEDRGVVLA